MTQLTANANRGLVGVALGMWHGDVPPSLAGAEGPRRSDAVYLLERLAH